MYPHSSHILLALTDLGRILLNIFISYNFYRCQLVFYWSLVMFQQVTIAFFCLNYASNGLQKVHHHQPSSPESRACQRKVPNQTQVSCTKPKLLLEIGQSPKCASCSNSVSSFRYRADNNHPERILPIGVPPKTSSAVLIHNIESRNVD
jgi:hypothetical protein